jgi:hypothetical protein
MTSIDIQENAAKVNQFFATKKPLAKPVFLCSFRLQKFYENMFIFPEKGNTG